MTGSGDFEATCDDRNVQTWSHIYVYWPLKKIGMQAHFYPLLHKKVTVTHEEGEIETLNLEKEDRKPEDVAVHAS